MGDVTVLKTARLYEADLLAEALEQEGVPHYRGMETFSGMRLAMPAMPVQGPGMCFTVFVPEAAAQNAQAILKSLSIRRQTPGIWSHSPRPWAKKVIIAYVWVVIVAAVIIGAFEVVNWLRLLF